MKGVAQSSEAFTHTVPLSTTSVGNATSRRSVAPLYRRKMKGIPALHWTTVHSPFGNRDRSGKKSFSATSRQPAPSAYYNRVSQTKFLSAGLFDPTFKKDQLESDERKRDLQRRRRLRENADSSVSLREKVSRNFLVTHAQHSQSTGDLSNVNRGEVPPPQHRWKRETSLSELLLAGPTFRETITHELEGQRPTNVRRCSFTYSPQQPPEIQNKLKIYNVDCTFREHFDGQTVLKEHKKTHTLRSTKQNKLVARIQNRPAEAEGTRSKEARPAAVQVADNSPRGCVKVAPGRKRSGRAGPLKPLYVAPVGDVCIADNGANLHSLRLYPWNALQAVPDPDLVTVATLPHYDQSFGRPNTPANPPPGFHGEMGSPTLSSESIHLLNGTIDSVNELKQKVAAAVVPEAIKSALPSMLGGNTAKGQLLLEAVVIELADALRRGPPDGTEKGRTYLLSFLQQQRGRPLRRKTVLRLLKRVQQRLCQNSNCTSADPSGDILASGKRSTRCYKTSRKRWPKETLCTAQFHVELDTNHANSKLDSSVAKPSKQDQPSLPDAHALCTFLKVGANDIQQEPTILLAEETNNYLQVQQHYITQKPCTQKCVPIGLKSIDLFHALLENNTIQMLAGPCT